MNPRCTLWLLATVLLGCSGTNGPEPDGPRSNRLKYAGGACFVDEQVVHFRVLIPTTFEESSGKTSVERIVWSVMCEAGAECEGRGLRISSIEETGYVTGSEIIFFRDAAITFNNGSRATVRWLSNTFTVDLESRTVTFAGKLEGTWPMGHGVGQCDVVGKPTHMSSDDWT